MKIFLVHGISQIFEQWCYMECEKAHKTVIRVRKLLRKPREILSGCIRYSEEKV